MELVLHFTKSVYRTGVALLIVATATTLFARPRGHEGGAGTIRTTHVSGPVTVGIDGNEPLIATAPDGTIYISALQHLYRSTDGGSTWTELAGPIYASSLNLNSDSSISVDPNGRLFFTFDYPYAGTTAVCTSDDRGDTFNCDPAVVPGGTDRMWVLASTATSAYEVTNQGLYETAFLQSANGGSTWTPTSIGAGILEPQTGPLLQQPGSADVLQITKIYGTLPSDIPELKVYVFHPSTPGSIISDVRGTGLPLPGALPSAALSRDNQLWVATEEANPDGGKQVVLAHSTNAGATWLKLPPIPGTTTGTATFSWVAAGAPGHVGVVFYYAPENGDPVTLTTSNWSAIWAESFNANSATPTWSVRTLETNIHNGALCVAADCTGANRYSGDFISATIDKNDVAHVTWMDQLIDATTNLATGTPQIRYAKLTTTTAPAPSDRPHKRKRH